jgi:hypothetical protein
MLILYKCRSDPWETDSETLKFINIFTEENTQLEGAGNEGNKTEQREKWNSNAVVVKSEVSVNTTGSSGAGLDGSSELPPGRHFQLTSHLTATVLRDKV